MTESRYRTVVVGAGIAGLSLVEELLRLDVDPDDLLVVDAHDPARGSDNPGATFHALPGTSLAPDARKLEAARTALETITRWRGRWSDPPIREFPMVRPLGDGERSDRLRTSWAGGDAYPDWLDIRRLSAAELVNLEPRLSGWSGAFVYRPAFCVALGRARELLIDDVRESGVAFEGETALNHLDRRETGWTCEWSRGSVRADEVVLAVGRGMGDWFPNLAMDCRGGELFVTEPGSGSDLECAIHATGHLAPRPGGGLVAGATWWNAESLEERTDAEARRAIAEKCRDLLPDLSARSGRVWRGIRAGFGDYQPLVGPIPGHDGLHAMGGFGGTALLSVPQHARAMARHLNGASEALPELARADRMRADKWRPEPERIRESG